jgi:hypothetical protein
MSLSIDVTVLVNAAPVADHCTLVGGMVYVDILEQAVVRFVARDLDRLPTVTKAEFAGTHAWCGLTPDEVPLEANHCQGGSSTRPYRMKVGATSVLGSLRAGPAFTRCGSIC